jgi:hypothetical protein
LAKFAFLSQNKAKLSKNLIMKFFFEKNAIFFAVNRRKLKSQHRPQTLIVVTADHSHVMTIMGYPKRGSDIRGLTGNPAKDGLPEPILSYANGPGASQGD